MTRFNEYRRILGYSYILYIVLIIPISLIHELGHIAICSANGYQFDVWLDLRGGHSICYEVFGNNQVMGVMGGIFGSLASLGILTVWYLSSKRLVPFAVVALALLLDQGSKIILEGFFPRLYSDGNFDVLITISQVMSVALFAIYFARRQRFEGTHLHMPRESRLDA
ncbi:MAG: hypothetical protein ACJ70Z_07725 [Nitrososphaera sp.]